MARAASWPFGEKTSKSERFLLVISKSSRRLAIAMGKAWGEMFSDAQIKKENSYVDKDCCVA